MNVLRVRGADAMQKAMKEAEQGKYEQGQKILNDIQG